MDDRELLVDVIPLTRMPAHQQGIFTYVVPASVACTVGSFVRIPFRSAVRWGVVCNAPSLHTDLPLGKIRPVGQILPDPRVSPVELALVRRIAALFGISHATAAYLMLPTPPLRAASHDSRAVAANPHATIDEPRTPEWVVKLFSETSPTRVLLVYHSIEQRIEVMCAVARRTLSAHRSLLILTAQVLWRTRIVDALRAHGFPTVILDRTEGRNAQWDAYRASRSQPCVVVGTRTAVYTPPPLLGAIVLDDAASDDHKQCDAQPKYDAREVATWVANEYSVPLIAISPAPRVVDWVRSPLRIDLGRPQTHTRTIVDLDHFWRGGNSGFLSPELLTSIRDALDHGRAAVILHNRRGRMARVRCADCAQLLSCATCTRPLVEHEQCLRCHQCGTTSEIPLTCPQCASTHLASRAPGTVRIAQILARAFPGVEIARVDREQPDAPSPSASIIVGSERFLSAIAPLFTRDTGCVAILHAERFTRADDYRAQERLFSALRSAEVFARTRKASFFVQTSDCTAPAIAALDGGLSAFYRRELEERSALNYPPAVRLLRLDAKNHTADAETIRQWTNCLPRGTVRTIDGPYERRTTRAVHRSLLLRLDPAVTDETIAEIARNASPEWIIDLDPVAL